jgi:hypothetical protein
MLAEKFLLLLEALRSAADRSETHADGGPRIVSNSPHVPVSLQPTHAVGIARRH